MKISANIHRQDLIHSIASQLNDHEIVEFVMDLDEFIADSNFTADLLKALLIRSIHQIDNEVSPTRSTLDSLLGK